MGETCRYHGGAEKAPCQRKKHKILAAREEGEGTPGGVSL